MIRYKLLRALAKSGRLIYLSHTPLIRPKSVSPLVLWQILDAARDFLIKLLDLNDETEIVVTHPMPYPMKFCYLPVQEINIEDFPEEPEPFAPIEAIRANPDDALRVGQDTSMNPWAKGTEHYYHYDIDHNILFLWDGKGF